MLKDYLFVYGSLCRFSEHPMHQVLLQHAEFVCPAKTIGLLYEIDGYPGMLLPANANDQICFVRGELYQVKQCDVLFTVLDDYEECSSHFPRPHEYLRQKVEVITETQHTIMAWCYLYNWPVTNKTRITDGDYRRFSCQQGGPAMRFRGANTV